jgi:hypothetical protein
MDGGRILLELLWYKMPFEKAAAIAVSVSRVIAVAGGIFGYIYMQSTWILILAILVFLEAPQQAFAMGEGAAAHSFSLRECFRQRRRRMIFMSGVQRSQKEELSENFHTCAICKRTEIDAPEMVFRIAGDGNEYCLEHLPSRIAN